MCGIAGIIGAGADDAETLQRMADSLVHRGPDGGGVWIGSAVALAHRRLAILDLSDLGAQPMHFGDRYVLVFNGEIYNYVELREELAAAGYRFTSATDSEVLIAAFDRWGVECLRRFNGMWAFAIVDRVRRRLFMARDRFGVKPLHYAQTNVGFVFASEIKALLKHPSVSGAPDEDYCRRFIDMGPSEFNEGTAFASVFRLPAATYVEAALDDVAEGRWCARRYWSLDPNLSQEPWREERAQEYAEAYLAILRDAVRLRLRADVALGSALSGGLDSSSIVRLVNDELRRLGAVHRQATFSCVYASPGTEYCDESSYIQSVAGALDVNSYTTEPHVGEVLAEHQRMIYFLDTPPDSSLMSSWHTFKLVSQTSVVVTLDGQGADEQLGGYPRYIVPHLSRTRGTLAEARDFLRMPGVSQFVGLGLAGAATRRVGMPSAVPRLLRAFHKQIWTGISLNEQLVEDATRGLANLLHYADRTSMAFSIESRMPFLDFRLAEFLAALPATYKLHGGWTKHVARLAMAGLLPDEIVWRRDKMGWPIPEDVWFKGLLRTAITERLQRSEFLADVTSGVSRKVTDGPIRRLVRLLNLAEWHRIHVERTWAPEQLPSHRVGARMALPARTAVARTSA